MRSNTDLEVARKLAISLAGDPLGLGNLTAKTLPLVVEQSRKFAQEIEAKANEADKAFLIELLRLPEVLQDEILESIQRRNLRTRIETDAFVIEVTFEAKPGAELEPSLKEALAQVTKDFMTKIGKGRIGHPEHKCVEFLQEIREKTIALRESGVEINHGTLASKLGISEGQLKRKCRQFFGGKAKEACQRAITLSSRF
jgi:superfamily II helicase